MSTQLRATFAPCWTILLALLALFSSKESSIASAQDEPANVRVQIEAEDLEERVEETRRSEVPHRRSSAARDIAREDGPARTRSRESQANSRRPPVTQDERRGRQAESDDYRNDFEELPRGRQAGPDTRRDVDRNYRSRYDDRDTRINQGAERDDMRRRYRGDERLNDRDRDFDGYAPNSRDRRSYDRDRFERNYDDYSDRGEYERRPPPRRRGLLRERLRERLEEARENPEWFAERVETVIRGTDQLRSVLAPRDEYADDAREVFGPGRERGPALGVTLDTRTPGRVRIARVRPGSPAERAGLQPGDEVLLVDGRRVSSPDLLVQYLSEIEPVEEVEIVVKRAGQELTVWADVSPQADESTDLPTDEVYEPNSTGERYQD